VTGTSDEPTPRSAAVTGAAGYLGVNLVGHLQARGWKIRTVARRPLAGVDTTGIEHTIADVRDSSALARVFAGIDVVFHLAARITLATDDPEAWDINVRGPAVVAAAVLESGARMVHCSSVHSFDLAAARPRLNELSARSTARTRPLYDRSKFAGETEVRKVIAQGLDATIVNPTGIIGPIDLGPSRMNGIIDAAARGRLPVVIRGGFDWVDVRDVVSSLVAASERGRPGENYLLPGHHASVLHVARLAAAFTGRRGPLIAVPGRLARSIAPLGERVGGWLGSDVFTPASVGTLVEEPIVDGDKARRELGHEPRPLEDTIRDTVRWFEGHSQL